MYYVKNVSLVFMLIGLSYCQTGIEQEEELTAKMMRGGAGAAGAAAAAAEPISVLCVCSSNAHDTDYSRQEERVKRDIKGHFQNDGIEVQWIAPHARGVIGTSFPKDVPSDENYDVIWFAGCNKLFYEYAPWTEGKKAHSGVLAGPMRDASMLENFAIFKSNLNDEGIIIFTDTIPDIFNGSSLYAKIDNYVKDMMRHGKTVPVPAGTKYSSEKAQKEGKEAQELINLFNIYFNSNEIADSEFVFYTKDLDDGRWNAPLPRRPYAVDAQELDYCGLITTQGCCDDNTARWCNEENELESSTCDDGEVCGWRTRFYMCVNATSELADPTEKHPRACPQ